MTYPYSDSEQRWNQRLDATRRSLCIFLVGALFGVCCVAANDHVLLHVPMPSRACQPHAV
jgi:hypothetical protein